MKKIKKINLVKINSSQMKELIGGYSVCYMDTLGPADPACEYSQFFNLNGKPVGGGDSGGGSGGNGGGSSSGCGCSYCIVEDGGFGFSVGMMLMGRNDMG